MADTEIMWRGLTLGGDSSYIVNEVSGWDDLPDITSYDEPRTRGHGDHVGDQYARSRTVTVSGKVADSVNRDSLVRVLQDVTLVSSTVEDLSVEFLGRRLTAGARIIRRAISVGMNYSVGEVPFALQWKCPDPLRYGLPQSSLSTGLATSAGGMSFPMTFPMDFGTSGSPGQITLFNDGTAPAPIVATVTGSLPSGFEVSTTAGQRIRYEYPVASGEVLSLDTGEGTLVTGGSADRRPYLTVSDWVQVPPQSSVTLQFSSLGGAYDAAATLTVPSFRSAWW